MADWWVFGPYKLDAAERLLLRNGQPVSLTPKLFETLLILVQNAGHLVAHDELIRGVWKDTIVEEGNLAHNISVLRKLLGNDSSRIAYIETVARHGYRFTAAVKASTRPAPVQSGSRPRIRRAIQSLAVLPLLNLSGDPAQEYFIDGMTDALITGLAQVLPIRVISRTSIMQYKGHGKPLAEIGEELGVDAIVEGSVLRAGKRVRITVQLLHAASDCHMWAANYERELSNVLTLQRELSEAIAREISSRLKKRRRDVVRNVPTLAYDAYLRGRYHLNVRTEDGLKNSLELFKEAIRKDPGYALAYSGLADAYALLAMRRLGGINFREAIRDAQKAANRAVELDETLAEAHLSSAIVKFQFEWDWKNAERDFRRAIRLNPNAASSHHRYAMYLATMSRMTEAMHEIDVAAELDPLSPIVATAKGRLLHFQRRYDQAIEHHRKALAIDPGFVEAHFNLGMVYEQKEMFDEAISEFRKAMRISGRAAFWWAGLGHAYALAGKTEAARRILKRLQGKAANTGEVSAFDLSWVYLGLGET
ncbi:MAG: tetratricopeptide repeat protein, partial [Acidobacteria bacterium]|nr:tetratricopeptide repeat protein [Acidobacteriota bacterium]